MRLLSVAIIVLMVAVFVLVFRFSFDQCAIGGNFDFGDFAVAGRGLGFINSRVLFFLFCQIADGSAVGIFGEGVLDGDRQVAPIHRLFIFLRQTRKSHSGKQADDQCHTNDVFSFHIHFPFRLFISTARPIRTVASIYSMKMNCR